MDQTALSSDSVLEMLLKTNRPPTDQEKAIIRESMGPAQAKLEVVETQISDTIAHIQALKAQVERAETKLQRLHEEEAVILESFADHRRVSSPFRNIPEDVLREICIACVADDIPKLYYRARTASPYVLAQICSGLRNIALTTPRIWASMRVQLGGFDCDNPAGYDREYSILARRAIKWFGRAGKLALTVCIEDVRSAYANFEGADSGSIILFDALLSYSTRWEELRFNSNCTVACTPMLRIAALTAVDVPLLRSVSIHLDFLLSDPVFHDSKFLTIPSLKRVTLKVNTVQIVAFDWANLTSVTLHGATPQHPSLSTGAIASILQQTRSLVFCDIAVGWNHSEHYHSTISLPLLKTLILKEHVSNINSSGAPSILDLIVTPLLQIFRICGTFLDLSLSDFLKRSPLIRKLSLPYSKEDTSLLDMMKLLRQCPSLAILSLWPTKWRRIHEADGFLRAFVEEGDSGVLCPRLQTFDFAGNVNYTPQTLRLFLESKHGEIDMPNVLPWKRVLISTREIKATETRQQILDLVSEKNAAGLDVQVICS
ncbi:hypothetical protein HYPSUDRAFT_204962 [Hypholoma sublateritium FD-334 SS-4]|uniref:F-box domain-containing protein n=1 Tax=Hypholoma sublateritium (strain FD-334 SS-4) TaxID=945553 RepID=A0A0D2KWQ4_HYPSF|nr:hypothetical protein HYPSUDRAFT_204962 [Hypholoma sublateritium FD-334 SS-4]